MDQGPQGKGDTKVLFSIMVGEIARVPMVEFVQNVAKDAVLWDVDGVDLDFEPFAPEPALIKAAKALRPALREALGREPLITAPVYSPWGDNPDDWTPLADVEAACAWEPSGGTKKGVMLYAFSYDVEIRAKGGTGYPDFTFTETIERKLA